jgi:hypothetical protein
MEIKKQYFPDFYTDFWDEEFKNFWEVDNFQIY